MHERSRGGGGKRRVPNTAAARRTARRKKSPAAFVAWVVGTLAMTAGTIAAIAWFAKNRPTLEVTLVPGPVSTAASLETEVESVRVQPDHRELVSPPAAADPRPAFSASPTREPDAAADAASSERPSRSIFDTRVRQPAVETGETAIALASSPEPETTTVVVAEPSPPAATTAAPVKQEVAFSDRVRALTPPTEPVRWSEADAATRALLLEGDTKAAVEAAMVALREVPTDPHPSHVAAVALHLDGDARAGDFADRAVRAWQIAGPVPPDGLLNAAAIHLEPNPSRAGRLLADDLARRAPTVASLDEDKRRDVVRLSDALGTCLGVAEADGLWTSWHDRTLKFKIDLDEKVGTSDGTGRFGDERLPVAEARQRWAALFEASEAVARGEPDPLGPVFEHGIDDLARQSFLDAEHARSATPQPDEPAAIRADPHVAFPVGQERADVVGLHVSEAGEDSVAVAEQPVRLGTDPQPSLGGEEGTHGAERLRAVPHRRPPVAAPE